MDKDFIISEIRRLAAENGGVPPGMRALAKQTGIKTTDWRGKHWARWNDAVAEAGFQGRSLNTAYDRDFVAGKLVALVRELGRWPSLSDIMLKSHNDEQFPHYNTFESHLGKQSERAEVIVSYCQDLGGLDDVVEICRPHVNETKNADIVEAPSGPEGTLGYVYLMKSGKYYKIGRTNSPDRRQYEIGIQLPEELVRVHSIETDDPSGIEAYWHKRFEDKRVKGEWFDLGPDDVRVFRRRKFM